MNKKIKFFLISSLSTLIFTSIAIVVVFYLTFTDLSEVTEKDWNDDWEKEYLPSQSTNFLYYSHSMYYSTKRYIIKNFANNSETTQKSLMIIDSLKYKKNDSTLNFKFLWNGKYNHDWRVEYVNQKYVDEIASLFSVYLICPEKQSRYLFEEIYLYPALEKKHKKIYFTVEGNKIITDYPNGFDFFIWKDLQDTTRVLHQTKQKDSFILTNKRDNKKMAVIRWKDNGYRLYF